MDRVYNIGDLVWAKMKTYAPWPGRVATPNDKVKKPPKGTYLFIYFFGSKNFAWVRAENVKDYLEYKEKYTQNIKLRALRDAVDHIEDYIKRKEESPGVTLEEDNDLLDENVNVSDEDEEEELESEEEETPVKKKPKQRKSSISSNKNKVASTTTTTTTPTVTTTPNTTIITTTTTSSNISSSARKRKSEENGSSPLPTPKSKGAKKSVFEQEITRVVETSNTSMGTNESSVDSSHVTFGLFGLGIMGSAILKNLVSNGQKVNVWTRSTKPKNEELISHLTETYPDIIKTYDDAIEVVLNSDVILSCVSDPAAVKDIVYGNCGLLDEIELHGKGYVEMTTVDPESSMDISNLITSKGGRYLEAQIQGSKNEAENGNLIILGAGDRNLFFQCKSCFKAIAKGVYYLGEVGYACKMNLALQVMKSIALVGVAEGLALAESAGITISGALEIFELTGLNCQYLNDKARAIITKDFKNTQQSVQNIQKDLRLALQISDTLIHPLIMASKANEVYKRVKSLGYENQDASSVFMGVHISRNNTPSPEPVKVKDVDQLP